MLLERPDGTTLYVEKYGPPDAPAITLTHGAGANRTSWYYVIRHLSLRFQLIVWEMPGLGHSYPVCTTTASGLMRALQKPVLEPLLHLTVWLAPAVWLMSWLGYFNGSSHLVGMMAGFAGTQTRGQLDLAVRSNPLAWPAVQAHETLAMFSYDATEVLGSITAPALVFTGHLDRLIVPQTALHGRPPAERCARPVETGRTHGGVRANQRLVELLSGICRESFPSRRVKAWLSARLNPNMARSGGVTHCWSEDVSMCTLDYEIVGPTTARCLTGHAIHDR